MIYSASDVFCDWLDTTYAAESSVATSVSQWVHANGGDCLASDEKATLFGIGALGGTVKIDTAKKYTKVSASGQALAHFRARGLLLEYLSELSTEPHNVSRIDVSIDLPQDGAEVVNALRAQAARQHGLFALGRKSLPVKLNLGFKTSDGRETGSVYIGGRSCKARVKAAIYDKAHEALEKRGEVLPPTTRYELRIKGEKGRVGPSLRDAAEPTALFWHHASPSLLKAPDNAPEWIAGWEGGWTYDKPAELLPSEILVRAIDFSSSLAKLIDLADDIGPNGRKYLLRRLEHKILRDSPLDS